MAPRRDVRLPSARSSPMASSARVAKTCAISHSVAAHGRRPIDPLPRGPPRRTRCRERVTRRRRSERRRACPAVRREELTEQHRFRRRVWIVQPHERDVEGLAREDRVSPLDVISSELMAAMRSVRVLPQFGDSAKCVASTRTHRASFSDVSAGGSDRPVDPARLSQSREHVAEHHRASGIARAQSENL